MHSHTLWFICTGHTSPTHSASSHHISSRRSHSQSQHQHDPPQPRHGHERQSSDEIRRYYHHSHSASQQPLRSHSHHASPKRTYIQSAGHSDSRLVAEHHYPAPPGVVMVGRRRSREEHEEVGGGGGRYIDQRRKSADPALLVNYDPTAPPPFRGTSSSAYNMTAPGEMSGNKEKRSSRLPFDDLGSDEGSSQSCDIVNPSGITFTLEETDDIKSASSSSTLVENSSGSPPRHQLQPDITAHKSPREQQLSQETFTEDDRQNLMVILSPLCEGIPLSSQPHYYDPSFNQAPPYFSGLSQPSPPKSRHGKSLTDISSATAVAPMAMGGNSNLLALQRQFLSQSVELPHLTQHSTGQRYATDSLPRHARLVTQPQQQQQGQGHGMKHTQSVPHSQMYRMASDSHLNYDGPPGQKMSVAGALARVKEEIEQQKKQPHQQQQARQRGGQNHMRKQFRSHHLQKKHVQATVISPQTNRPKTSSLEKSRYHEKCYMIVQRLYSQRK